MKNKLTIIVPFLNEGEEVGNTLRNIRRFSKSIPILLINDSSNDGMDYEEIALKYGAKYHLNKARKGVAASRNLGVEMTETPYFLLLDAHVRFYTWGWINKIVNHLEENYKSILCFKNIPLSRSGKKLIRHKMLGMGSDFVLFEPKNDNFFFLNWRNQESRPNQGTEETASVLGGSYAASKLFWNEINGLNGLEEYGCDEIMLSFKAWMMGGNCSLVKDISIGHIYRSKFPYEIKNSNYLYNILYISRLILPFRYNILVDKIAKIIYKDVFAESYLKCLSVMHDIDNQRDKYKENRLRNFEFIEKINHMVPVEICNTIPSNQLENIYKKLLSYRSSNQGLKLSSRFGSLIFLFLYDHYLGNKRDKKILQIELSNLLNKRECLEILNFEKGLLGVGWGLIYLKQLELTDTDILICLKEIDNEILNLNLELLNSFSKQKRKEILLYCLARISGERQIHESFRKILKFYNQNYRKELNESDVELYCHLDFALNNNRCSLPMSINQILKINNSNVSLDLGTESIFDGLPFLGISTITNIIEDII